MHIFIDTNILLDVLMGREKHVKESAIIWDKAARGQVKAFVSAISFNNIFYIVRKYLGTESAYEAISSLRNTFNVVALDEQIMNQAIDAKWNDLEDAIQFFSALHCNADFIVSRNIKDFKNSSIAVLTPSEFTTLEKI